MSFSKTDRVSHQQVSEVTGISEVTKITRTMCKTSTLDLLSCDHIKQNLFGLAIAATCTANACLVEGVMPPELERALVHMLLRRHRFVRIR